MEATVASIASRTVQSPQDRATPLYRGMDESASTRDELSGPRLVRATRRIAVEDENRSRWLLAQTLALVLGLHVAIFLVPMWLKPILSLFVGLVYVRLFIFYHDYLHGAQLRTSRVAAGVLEGVGYLMLT